MAHQVTGNEDLVDEVNDPIHTHDVTRDHFGFLVESDAILVHCDLYFVAR